MPRRGFGKTSLPLGPSGDTVFPVQVRFEEDRYPFDTALQRPEDFYYWNYIISGATNGTGWRSFPLDLTGRTGDVTLKVRLMGWSSTTNDPDHRAEFSFNGTLVGSITFDGQEVKEADLVVPLSAVSNGVNALTVKGILQPGRSFSYFVVDRIDAAFDRELAPLATTAHFHAGGAAAVSAAAFSAPLALDEAGNPTWIADGDGALPAKAWTVSSENERFAVIEAGAIPMLEPEPAAADAWFLSETNRIDYLVIVSRALAPAAQELADYRASQGLRVGVAVYEDVCDWMADGLPDIAIGRLPALTAADLSAMIAKIKAYESGFGQAWQNQMMLASDTTDAEAGNFSAANTRLAALAGEPFPVARIDLDTLAIAPARTSLSNWFKAGAGFIHYTGHGGVANWSGKNLMKAADVAAMTNATRPSIAVALSCLVGRYEAPAVNCLGELLMRRAQGGAVAVWASSGMSRNGAATELGEAFYRAVLQEGSGTLGLAVWQARRSPPGNRYTRDTFAPYNLLGDPALRIAGNTGGQPSDATFAQWRWQRFSPQALTNAALSGATTNNFCEYAMGNGGSELRAELPEFGYPLSGEIPAVSDGFILRWKRRIQHSDVDYQLFLSDDTESNIQCNRRLAWLLSGFDSPGTSCNGQQKAPKQGLSGRWPKWTKG